MSTEALPIARGCFLTVPKIARRFGVSPNKIGGWIRSGELRAVNVAATVGGRPRWRISESELAAFESRRSNSAPVVKMRRKRQTDVTEFF